MSTPALPPSSLKRCKHFDFDRLLVVRPSAMGDIIHTLPAVAAFRAALPEVTIGWVVEERWVELLCSPTASLAGPPSSGRPLADRIHPVNTKSWRHSLASPDTWRQVFGSIGDLRVPHYKVAIDFQGSLRSSLIARLSGAKEIYGFAHPREGIAKIFYTQRAIATGAHVIEQNLSLAAALVGAPLQIANPQLPRDAAAERECDRYLIEHKIERLALLNPGAGWGAKQWPAERYGELAKRLSEENGVKCLINYGPGEHPLATVAETSSEGCANSINLSLTQLIAFTRRATIFIGGDTGPMHLAAALSVPVVTIFGPTDPARNGPFGTKNIILRSPLSLTSHKRRTEPDKGLLKITVEDVVASARRLLRESRV